MQSEKLDNNLLSIFTNIKTSLTTPILSHIKEVTSFATIGNPISVFWYTSFYGSNKR